MRGAKRMGRSQAGLQREAVRHTPDAEGRGVEMNSSSSSGALGRGGERRQVTKSAPFLAQSILTSSNRPS